MKYVLMYTNRPDLDAAVPAERQQEVYQAIYAWFEKHGCGDRRRAPNCSGRRRPPRSGPARTGRRSSSTGRSPRPRRTSAGSASSTCPTWMRRSRWSRTGRRWRCRGSAVEIRPMVEDYS